MSSLISTIPAVVEMPSTETRPFILDVTTILEDGEAPTAAVTRLINLGTEEEYEEGLLGGPGIAGNFITQYVTGLEPKNAYRLDFTFTLAPNKSLTESLRLECKF
jgi:hypothetical protein